MGIPITFSGNQENSESYKAPTEFIFLQFEIQIVILKS